MLWISESWVLKIMVDNGGTGQAGTFHNPLRSYFWSNVHSKTDDCRVEVRVSRFTSI